MLLELSIRDFAIVDQLKIVWNAGLTVLTGETGAGKSIIVDAVGALLGDRLGPETVRAGRERAFVEGIFASDGAESNPTLRALLQEHDLADENGQLILSREVARGGRSVARVNGRAVPASLLQLIGEHLVDIHGQSQHLSLLRPREHLEYLDRFAGLIDARQSMSKLIGRWRALQAERRKLQQDIRIAGRERELLRHEVAEIDAASLHPDEDAELQNQRQRLRHAEKLRQAVEKALLALQGLDEQRGALDLLGEAAMLCTDAGHADNSLNESSEGLTGLAGEAEEFARGLRRYLDGFEVDPSQRDVIEERFLAVADLKRKYGDTVEAVLEYLERARQRLATAERGDELLSELSARERALQSELTLAALDLSRQRRAASAALAGAVEQELAELSMVGARLLVSIEQQADEQGIAWPVEGGPRLVAVDATGADRVEFLFSANPGEPPRGLGRIASGGELARVALALKAVLSRLDRRGTLIFDEIDVGVGGRAAPVVGQKLWTLTRTHQVLCITHMPQVAAYADHHLVVAKRLDGDTTRTAVEPLNEAERTCELAAMLGGTPGSEAAAANARELLERSDQWKHQRPDGMTGRASQPI